MKIQKALGIVLLVVRRKQRAVPLAFHLCYYYFCAVLVVRIPFPFGVWSRLWNSIVLVSDHCLFIVFKVDIYSFS